MWRAGNWRATTYTILEMSNCCRNLALEGAHLRAQRFIHEKSKIKRREVENNPRAIITVGFSKKQCGVEASSEGVFASRSHGWGVNERAWAGPPCYVTSRAVKASGSECAAARCTLCIRHTSRLFIINAC